jgi:hypothetical protein
MAIKLTVGASIPADEWIDATLTEIAGNNGELVFNDSACFRFIFELADPKYSGRKVTVLTGQNLTPGAKLTRIVGGMLGRDLVEGEELDLETFVGREFQIMAETTSKQGRSYYNVAKVRTKNGQGADEEIVS